MAFEKFKGFFRNVKSKLSEWWARTTLNDVQKIFAKNLGLPADLALQAYKLSFGFNAPVKSTMQLMEQLYHLRPDIKGHELPAFQEDYPIHWLKLDREHAKQVLREGDFNPYDWKIGYNAFKYSAMSNERTRDRFIDFCNDLGIECAPQQATLLGKFISDVLKVV